MGNSTKSVHATESENEWKECVECREHIGVHPKNDDNCPNCHGHLEPFGGYIYECATCGTEYVGKGDAKDCC